MSGHAARPGSRRWTGWRSPATSVAHKPDFERYGAVFDPDTGSGEVELGSPCCRARPSPDHPALSALNKPARFNPRGAGLGASIVQGYGSLTARELLWIKSGMSRPGRPRAFARIMTPPRLIAFMAQMATTAYLPLARGDDGSRHDQGKGPSFSISPFVIGAACRCCSGRCRRSPRSPPLAPSLLLFVGFACCWPPPAGPLLLILRTCKEWRPAGLPYHRPHPGAGSLARR